MKIEHVLDEMAKELKAVGVSEETLYRYKRHCDKKHVADWIHQIFVNEFTEVAKIRCLLPEDVWQTYVAMAFDGEEVCLLHAAQKKLKLAFNRGIKIGKAESRHKNPRKSSN
jgi:hypothetical protein